MNIVLSITASLLLVISFFVRLSIVLDRLNKIELNSENFKAVFKKFSYRLLELVFMFFSHFFAILILCRVENIPYLGILCFFVIIMAIAAFVFYIIDKVIKK